MKQLYYILVFKAVIHVRNQQNDERAIEGRENDWGTIERQNDGGMIVKLLGQLIIDYDVYTLYGSIFKRLYLI